MREPHEPPYFAAMARRILGRAQVQEGVSRLPGRQAGAGDGQEQVRVGRAFAKAL
jgi:hypothetical protein